jgi:hypothetical protein
MNNWIPIICLIIGILVGGITTALFMINSPLSHFFYKCPDLKCEKCSDCICNMTYKPPDCILYSYQDECNKPNSVIIAENLVREMNYTNDYNCDEYAWELLRRYKNAGYEASYCEGYLNYRYCNATNCRHAFVRLDNQYVEATKGQFISPQDFAEKYVKSFCVGN